MSILPSNESRKEQKMVGAYVDIDLAWKFKAVAASRQEEMQVAIANALRLYIDLPIEKEEE